MSAAAREKTPRDGNESQALDDPNVGAATANNSSGAALESFEDAMYFAFLQETTTHRQNDDFYSQGTPTADMVSPAVVRRARERRRIDGVTSFDVICCESALTANDLTEYTHLHELVERYKGDYNKLRGEEKKDFPNFIVREVYTNGIQHDSNSARGRIGRFVYRRNGRWYELAMQRATRMVARLLSQEGELDSSEESDSGDDSSNEALAVAPVTGVEHETRQRPHVGNGPSSHAGYMADSDSVVNVDAFTRFMETASPTLRAAIDLTQIVPTAPRPLDALLIQGYSTSPGTVALGGRVGTASPTLRATIDSTQIMPTELRPLDAVLVQGFTTCKGTVALTKRLLSYEDRYPGATGPQKKQMVLEIIERWYSDGGRFLEKSGSGYVCISRDEVERKVRSRLYENLCRPSKMAPATPPPPPSAGSTEMDSLERVKAVQEFDEFAARDEVERKVRSRLYENLCRPSKMSPATPPPPPSAGSPEMDYLERVKAVQKFDEFAALLKEFRQTRSVGSAAKDRLFVGVLNLFRGHDDLASGFKSFLNDDDGADWSNFWAKQKMYEAAHDLANLKNRNGT
jgi:hypothetical protein